MSGISALKQTTYCHGDRVVGDSTNESATIIDALREKALPSLQLLSLEAADGSLRYTERQEQSTSMLDILTSLKSIRLENEVFIPTLEDYSDEEMSLEISDSASREDRSVQKPNGLPKKRARTNRGASSNSCYRFVNNL